MSRIADIRTPKAARLHIPDTATRILDTAERLVQSRGYNGFSYADIAARLGITKASLHHHFETKATLGQALIERYHAHFMQALATIDTGGGDAAERLRSYARLYAAVLEGERLCLCGMLAAEYDTLPAAMQEGIRQFSTSTKSGSPVCWSRDGAAGGFTGAARRARPRVCCSVRSRARCWWRVPTMTSHASMLQQNTCWPGCKSPGWRASRPDCCPSGARRGSHDRLRASFPEPSHSRAAGCPPDAGC